MWKIWTEFLSAVVFISCNRDSVQLLGCIYIIYIIHTIHNNLDLSSTI